MNWMCEKNYLFLWKILGEKSNEKVTLLIEEFDLESWPKKSRFKQSKFKVVAFVSTAFRKERSDLTYLERLFKRAFIIE